MPRSHRLTPEDHAAIKVERASGMRRNSAFGEADRLAKSFNTEGRLFATRPLAVLFEIFGAFQKAYKDTAETSKTGYFLALNDVYGLNGNAHNLYVNRTRQFENGEISGDKNLFLRDYVAPETLISLYTQMGDQDRTAFKTAFNEFTQAILPNLRVRAPNYAFSLIEPLAKINLAIAHGSGALTAHNDDTLMQQSMKQILFRAGEPAAQERPADDRAIPAPTW